MRIRLCLGSAARWLLFFYLDQVKVQLNDKGETQTSQLPDGNGEIVGSGSRQFNSLMA